MRPPAIVSSARFLKAFCSSAGVWGGKTLEEIIDPLWHHRRVHGPPRLQVFSDAESVVVAEPDVFALVLAGAEVSPEVVVLVIQPEVISVAVVSVGDVAEHQASADIAVAFDVSVPVSVVAVEVDSSGRPRFLASPNVDYYASSSSSVEVAG